MEIRHVRYFLAVAEEASFRRAAERLNISQPPLSSQIRDLEQELGTTLFHRSAQGVELTMAGKFLLEPLRDLLDRFNNTLALAKSAGRGEAGRLRIGFLASVSMHEMFPRILRAFRQRYPDVVLDMSHLPTGTQLEMLANDQLDLGFLRPLMPSSPLRNIQMIELWRDRLEIFFSADHPLSRSDGAVDLEALADEAFVTFKRQVGSGLFEHTLALCKGAGFVPRVVQQSSDGGALLGFVGAGLGVAILPRVYATRGLPGVGHRELRARDANTGIALARTLNKPAPLAERFLRLVEEVRDAGSDDLMKPIPG